MKIHVLSGDRFSGIDQSVRFMSASDPAWYFIFEMHCISQEVRANSLVVAGDVT